MLLLLNYLLQIVMGLLQLARPQVLLTPHRLMVWANCLKIVCCLWSKCVCSVYIYFILPGNWSVVVFCFFFFLVRHETVKNMDEIDLLNLTIWMVIIHWYQHFLPLLIFFLHSAPLWKSGENFLVAQWLGLCASSAGGMSSIPGPGIKGPCATVQPKEKRRKLIYRTPVNQVT